MPSYQPKHKPRKTLTQKEYRALHRGHYFRKDRGHHKQGGQCECGLTKSAYTLKCCAGYNISVCTKKTKGRTQ